MRGRQFVAWMILVAFILLMCSACHSAEDAVKDTTGEAQTTDAADVSGSAGETEGEIGTKEEPDEIPDESTKKERYEAITAELTEIRFEGQMPEDMPWLKPQVITTQKELRVFKQKTEELWGIDKRTEQKRFDSVIEHYSSEGLEEKALIGLFVRQYNWDYTYDVEIIKDNEMKQLELTLFAQRPEAENYVQDCTWILMVEVDRSALEGIEKTTVEVKKTMGGSRNTVWSDVVVIPGSTEEQMQVIKGAEALQAKGQSWGVAESLDWKVLTRNYMVAREAENAIIAFTMVDGSLGYDYDARVIFDQDSKELTVEVFRCDEGKTKFQAISAKIILVEVKRSDLEKAIKIKGNLINVRCTKEDLAEWNRPYGVADKLLSSHSVDLDHDGTKEELYLYYLATNFFQRTVSELEVGVIKDGEILWSERRTMAPNPNGIVNAYFLYQQEGKDYLLFYSKEKSTQDREYGSNFKCFYLDEKGSYIQYDSDSIWLTWRGYKKERFPIPADRLQSYADHANRLLENSVCLYSELDGEIYLAPSIANQAVGYYEDLSLLFSDDADYSGCTTIAEKTAVFNQKRLEEWFADGQVPEMPEEFKLLMCKLITEKRGVMSLFPQLRAEERSVWFKDYNGEKLQIVEPEYESTSPASYPGKVYYRADAGETPEEVAKIMVEAMVQRMMEDSQGQEFVITKYRITDQHLTSWEDIVANYTNYCWEEYLAAYRGVKDNLLEYAEKWVKESFAYGKYEAPLSEDMWYFYPSGYYHFEGWYLGTFESYAEMETVVDGMVRFYYQGGNPQFILVKYGDVYCMQKGTHWGE
ncbi:MAG: hypothetical protein IIX65_04885 [Lachnospiraceae bacterium]|nr:hypothetical protein [Lachnospiraceae bacterium]